MLTDSLVAKGWIWALRHAGSGEDVVVQGEVFWWEDRQKTEKSIAL
jgi:hypothetical protein